MGVPSRLTQSPPRLPSYLIHSLIALAALTLFFLYQVDRFASRTKTVAGHNLDPTPWHLFPPKDFAEQTRQARNYKIIQCSYLTCPYNSNNSSNQRRLLPSQEATQCPQFFQFIHRDLEPWSKTGIGLDHLEETKKYAAFRVVIHKGKLYLDLYYACVQSRMMFTIWGLLQMMNKYSGLVPDVDMMFECMDKPSINKTEHQSMPLPLFRYCTTKDHFDIPFPDWSFWGWPEVNVRPWSEEFKDIKQGSKARSWLKKWPLAFWKGNPFVDSPVRTELLECNSSRKWGAQIMQQNWDEEARAGYQKSKLSNQCDYRYKIYAEGFAWSVSLKYIISCGSLSLIISPRYEEFLSRGLIPRKNYWPVSPEQLCPSIKSAVDWGNSNPDEAQAIGKAGQEFMETLSMDRVYDYMFHLINEYSKLQNFKPVPPPSALEVCEDSLLCLADPGQKKFLMSSTATASPTPPCNLEPPDRQLVDSLLHQKQKVIDEVIAMERRT